MVHDNDCQIRHSAIAIANFPSANLWPTSPVVYQPKEVIMQYPAWKYLLIAVVLIIAGLYTPTSTLTNLPYRLPVLPQVPSCLKIF